MSRAAASLGLLATTLLCLGMTCAQPPPVELATLPGATGSEPISYREQVKARPRKPLRGLPRLLRRAVPTAALFLRGTGSGCDQTARLPVEPTQGRTD